MKRVISRPHTIPRAAIAAAQQARARTDAMPPSPPPIPPHARRTQLGQAQPDPRTDRPPANQFDEELHAAPTMIIDINRIKRRRG